MNSLKSVVLNAVKLRSFSRTVILIAIAALATAVSAAYAMDVRAESLPAMLMRLAGLGGAAPAATTTAPASRNELGSLAPKLAPLTGDLATGRSGHTATRLADGRVLVAGGDAGGTAEIYDPATDSFSATGSMTAARSGHTASLLADGRVLIIGGTVAGSAVATTEVYDPATGTFSPSPSTNAARSGQTATTLGDGRVVVIAGDASGSIEIYDPSSNSFSPLAVSLASPRSGHAAAVLQNGNILVVGGTAPDGSNVQTGEIVDVANGAVSAVSNTMADAHDHALLRVLSDGKVQIIGGTDHADMEIYDPAINAFGAHSHVFPIGDSHPELVQQITDAPTRAALFYRGASGALLDREGQTITELPASNKALVVGGTDSSGAVLSSSSRLNSSPASITTDKLDYAPGTPVVVTGTGFAPNETVTLTFHEDPHPATENPHTFTVTTDANGNFTDQQYAPEDSDVGVAYVLAAVGGTSGYAAQTALADANNFNLTFAGAGAGSITLVPNTGTVNAPTACSGTGTASSSQTVTKTCSPNITFSSNSPTVTFTVAANSGSNFAGWSAANNLSSSTCTGTTSPCTALLGSNPALTATFNVNTSTTTTAANASGTYGDSSVTLNATVTPASGPAINSGTVTFTVKQGVTTIGVATTSSTVVGGAASVNYALPVGTSPGSYTIQATYNPGVGFNTSTNNPLATLSIGKAGTSGSVTSSENPASSGNPVVFTASIARTQGAATPTGTVQFKDGVALLGTVGLDASAKATFTTSTLSVATHSITAVYSGDTNYSGSTSAAFSQVINAPTCAPICLTDVWSTESSMPNARGGAMNAELNGKMYVISGFGSSGLTNEVDSFDPTTGIWTVKAPIPNARVYGGATSLNGKLYVVGGCLGNDCRIGTTNVVDVYDPTTNSWSSAAPLSVARHAFAMGTINGKIIVAGGRQACPPCNDAPTTEVYDPSTNTWSTKTGMPTPRNSTGYAVLNNLLYVVGGSTSSGVSGAVEAFDPAANSWSTQASMLTPRTAPGVASIGGKIFAISGQIATSPFTTNIVEAYDPGTNSWSSKAPIPTARYGAQPVSTNGRIYVAGNGAGNSAISTVESYQAMSLANMVAWYPGNNNTNDVMGGNNGTWVGTSAFNASGKVNQAFSFNGSSYVDAGNPAALNITGNQVSLDGWVNPTDTSSRIYFGKTLYGANDYLIFNNSGRLSSLIKIAGSENEVQGFADFPTNTVPYSMPVNQWTHVALTYDGSKIRLYANGAQVGEASKTGNIDGDNEPFVIGGRAVDNGTAKFTGGIDEVEVFNRAISAAEVKSIFDASFLGKCNTAPVANSQSVTTNANTPLPITLSATDAEGNFLTYLVNNGLVATTHGTLSATNSSTLVYTPTTGYSGPDSFTFKVNDGFVDSNTATVTINVHCTGPTVSTNPTAATVTYGAPTVTFTAAASGVPTPAVQWQVNTGSGFVNVTNGGNISGATSQTLTIANPTVAQSGSLYRAEFTSTCATADSSAALLTVNPKALTASIVGNPTKAYDGNTNATLTPANFSLSGLVGTDSFTVTKTSGSYNSPDVATANTVTAGLAAGDFTPNGGTLAANYVLPTSASGPGTIIKANQTITFAPLADKTYGDAPFAVSATGGASGNPVTFAASGNCASSGTNGATISITTPGICTVTASQAGNSNYNAATDVPRSFTINKAGTTSAVASSENPSFDGNQVAFTATVTRSQGAAAPTGTVDFKDGSTVLGTGTLDAGGHATFTASTLSVATHSITAVYSGDSNYSGSTSPILNQTVNAAACFLPRAGGGWNNRASVSSPYSDMGLEDVNGKLYAVGGTFGGCSKLNTLQAYDSTTDSWTQLAPMPTPRWQLGSASLGGKLYVAGGAIGCGQGSNVFEVYDPISNTWSTKAPLPGVARYGLQLAAANGKLYAIGGQVNGGDFADVWEYDPIGDTWAAKAPLPDGRTQHRVAVLNDLIYVTGGFNGAFQVATSTLFIYNPATDTWTSGASMPETRVYHAAATLNGKVYVYGGTTPTSSYDSSVISYDPSTNAWNNEPSMSVGRFAFGHAASGGKLYAVGGINASDYPGISSVEAFTPASLTNMVAWYPGNGNTNDVMGGNNGTLHGGGYSTGKVGQAFVFNGAPNNYVSAPNTAALQITNAFTVDAWIKPNSTQSTFASIVSRGSNSSGAWSLETIQTDGSDANARTLRFFFWSDDSHNYQVLAKFWLTSDKIGTWHHIAATYDSTTGDILLYDNGALIATSSGVDKPAAGTLIGLSNHELSIGSRQSTGSGTYDWGFDGGVDEVEIFNRALSAAEIKSIFDASFAGKCNTAPVADSQTVSTNAETAVPITLTASDAEGNFLAYSIVSGPSHGTLSGTAPNLTYTPAPGFFSPPSDSFTFKVNDGFVDSNTATVTINVHCTGPTVSTNPTAATVTYGAPTVTFTAAATGVPTPAVQWEVSTNGGASFTPVSNTGNYSGATTNTLTITLPTVAQSGSLYRAEFTSSCAVADSSAALLTVNPKALTASIVGNPTKVYDGNTNATLTPANFSISGLVGTESFTVTQTAGAYNSPDVATANSVTATLTPANFTPGPGTTAGNYSFPTSATGAGSITKATPTVSVSFAASPIIYDGNPHAASVTVTGVSGPLTGSDGTTQISYTKNAAPFAGTPTDVGAYTASATFTSTNGNYNNAASTTNATLTINKADALCTVTPYHVTYDATAHTASGGCIGVKSELLAGLDLTGTTHTNAGSYHDHWTFTDSTGNYNDRSGDVDDQIDQATPTLSTSGGTVTYDGNPHPSSATATGVGNVPVSGSFVYTYTPPGDATAPINASATPYAVSAAFTSTDPNYNNGTSATNMITINKASSSTVITCPASVVYDGSAKEPCSGTATGAGGLNVPVTVVYGNNINAGTAAADATYAGDSNHTGSTATQVTFTIEKAPSATVVTFESGPYVYRASAFTATANVTGAGGLNSPVTVVYSGDCTNVSVTNGCTATATFTGDANHFGSIDAKSITITKADASVTVNGFTGVYDTLPHGATGTATGVGGVDLSAGFNFGQAFIDVPGGTAHWMFSGGTNYNDQSGNAAIVIDKANATISVIGFSGVFDGDPHGVLSNSATGVGNVAISGLSIDPTTYTHVPGGLIHWTFINNNYNDQSGDASVTINKYLFNVCDGVGHCTGGSFPNDENKGGRLTITGSVPYGGNATAEINLSPASLGATDSLSVPTDPNPPFAPLPIQFKVYIGSNSDPAHPVFFGSGTATKTNSDTTWNTSITTALNTSLTPGDYTAYVYGDDGSSLTSNAVDADAGYDKAVTGDFSFPTLTAPLTITKATPTVTATGGTFTYDALPHPGSGSATGVGGPSDFLAPQVTLSFDTPDGLAPVDAGTWHVVAHFDGNGNYLAGDSAPAEILISPKDTSASVTASDKPYDGTTAAAIATCTVDGKIGSDDVTCVANGPNTFASKDVGTHQVTATGITLTGLKAGDYHLTPTSATTMAKITAVTLTASIIGDPTKVYDGNANATLAPANFQINGLVGTESFTVTKTTGSYNSADVPTANTVSTTLAAGDFSPAVGTLAGNYVLPTAASGPGHITKANSTTTVTCTPASVTYTGSPLTPCSVSVTGANLSLSFTPDYSNNTNAGTATATYTYAGDDNHFGSNGSQTFEITKASSSTVINCPPHVTYTGLAQTPCSATATGAGSLSTSVTVGYTNNTHAGTATANATYAGDANHDGSTATQVTFTIDKANVTCAVTGYHVTYDGNTHTATGSCVGVQSETLAGLDLSGTTHTNAGSFTDPWTFTDVTGNYTDTGDHVADAIDKANAIIHVDGSTGTYDATPHGATGTAVGVESTPANLNALLHLGLTFTDFPGGTAHWTFDGNGNYNPSYGDVPIVINKADAVCTINGYTGTYDAAPHGATGSCVGVAGDLSATGSSLDLGASFTDVPGGTAHWTFTGGTNYNDKSGDAAIVISEAASSTVITCPTSVTFTGSAQTPCSATATGAGNLNASVTVVYANNINAGTATADANYSGDGNHDGSTATQKTFTIGKAGATCSIIGYSGTYDGNSHGATGGCAGVGTDASAAGSSLDLGSTFENVPGGTATWTFHGGNNYNDQTGSVSITINKRTLTASIVGNPNKVYDGNANATLTPANFSIANLAGTENFAVSKSTGSYNSAGVATANTVSTTLSAGDFTPSGMTIAGNYNLPTLASGVGYISKAPLTVTASSQSVIFGGAVPSITPGYTGFVTGEGSTNLTTQPTCSTTYTVGSGVSGNPYPTTCTGAASQNYSFVYVNGQVTVIGYGFAGFGQPVDNSTPTLTVWNTAKATQAIPVKWTLTLGGIAVSDPTSFISLESYAVNCSTGQGNVDAAIEEVASGNSGLIYNGSGNWQFNWKTPNSYGGQCRAMFVRFKDGSISQVAYFKFK